MGGIKETTHLIKTSCEDFTADTSGRSVAEVTNFIRGFNATSITQAASAYESAAAAIRKARTDIEEQARQLAKVSKAESAKEPLSALYILWKTMGELADKLAKMRDPLQDFATVVTKHQEFVDDGHKGIMATWAWQGLGTWDDSIGGRFSVYSGYFQGDKARSANGSQDELAGHHLDTFGKDLARIHMALPDKVEKRLRDIKRPGAPYGGPDQVRYPTGNGGNAGKFSSPPYDGSGLNGGTNGAGSIDPRTSGPYDTEPGLVDPGGPTSTPPPGAAAPGGITQPPGSTNPGATDPNVPRPDITDPNTSGPDSTGTDPTGLSADTADLPRNPSTTGADPTHFADYQPNPNSYPPTSTTYPNPTTSGYGNPSTSHIPSGGTATGGGGFAAVQPSSIGNRAGTGLGTGPGMGTPFLPMGGAGGPGADPPAKSEGKTWLHQEDDVWMDDTPSVNGNIG